MLNINNNNAEGDDAQVVSTTIDSKLSDKKDSDNEIGVETANTSDFKNRHDNNNNNNGFAVNAALGELDYSNISFLQKVGAKTEVFLNRMFLR